MIEYLVSGDEKMRFFTLSGEQLLFCTIASLSNAVGLACKIVAYQNERPGLITLVGYIGLVYGFLLDLLLLDEVFVPIEIVGIVLILVVNILLIACGPPK